MKLKAREILSGSYGKVALIILICVSISCLIANVQVLLPYIQSAESDGYEALAVFVCATSAFAVAVFVIPPLKLGREKWFFSKAKGNHTKIRVFFSCFGKNALRSIRAWLAMRVLTILWTVVTFLPAFALSYSMINALKNGISVGIGIAMGISVTLFTVSGTAFLLLIMQRYFLVYYLVVSSSVGVIKAIRISAKIMEDKCIKTAKFKLSFLPWIIPCLFVFPAIYVWGYYKQSCACLAESFLHSLSTHQKAIVYGVA